MAWHWAWNVILLGKLGYQYPVKWHHRNHQCIQYSGVSILAWNSTAVHTGVCDNVSITFSPNNLYLLYTREVGKGRQLGQWGPVGEFPKLAAVAMIRDIETKAETAASLAQYCYNIQWLYIRYACMHVPGWYKRQKISHCMFTHLHVKICLHDDCISI